ncbi:hypothetical protein JNO63_03775 [Anaerococcus sp. mt242]|uniref:hypothetical protein n=1 Tax=Anaerococcus sp. mt242 TaxID=2661917 RepID=UPI0019336A75|nr:hypothetical protein [Anaerococcus sp. mt242]MBM0046206.1 hypothetical protein [Anaerococcus sp. mt242]
MDNNLLFRRQFVLTNRKKRIESWQEIPIFDDYKIYAHPNLQVVDKTSGDKRAIMLGYTIDPDNPEFLDEDIVNHLITYSLSADDFINNTGSLTGRWIFFYISDTEKIVFSDPATARSIYYSDDELMLGTNPNIINYYKRHQQDLSEDYSEYISSKYYSINEYEWYSDKTCLEQVYKLKPNHYYDLNRKSVERFWTDLDYNSYKETIDRVTELLVNSFKSLKNRDYDYIQSLTAGFDSRVVYAASSAASFESKFFLSTMNVLPLNHPDIVIARDILNDSNKDLVIIDDLADLSPEFINFYKENIDHSRILPKTLTIQHFLSNNDFGNNIMQITGNYSAVIKDNYKKNTAKDGAEISKLIGIPKKYKIFDKEFDQWIWENKDMIEEAQVYMMDLFYWEHRLPNWGTNFIANQDIAIDEFSPFNNREFFIRLMKARRAENIDYQKMFTDIINKLDPELMTHPINPMGTKGKIQDYIKDHVSKRTWEQIKIMLKK